MKAFIIATIMVLLYFFGGYVREQQLYKSLTAKNELNFVFYPTIKVEKLTMVRTVEITVEEPIKGD